MDSGMLEVLSIQCKGHTSFAVWQGYLCTQNLHSLGQLLSHWISTPQWKHGKGRGRAINIVMKSNAESWSTANFESGRRRRARCVALVFLPGPVVTFFPPLYLARGDKILRRLACIKYIVWSVFISGLASTRISLSIPLLLPFLLRLLRQYWDKLVLNQPVI